MKSCAITVQGQQFSGSSSSITSWSASAVSELRRFLARMFFASVAERRSVVGGPRSTSENSWSMPAGTKDSYVPSAGQPVYVNCAAGNPVAIADARSVFLTEPASPGPNPVLWSIP